MIEYEKIKDKEIEKLKRENEELREKLKGNDNVDNKMLELRAKNEVMADLLERIIGKK
jgi:cell division septum initiation protein DivIVA